ncbi:hypothetical protein ACKKBG_A27080 [Auxenochlorella protothecoides x Auxenochlorella symbiontica]
MAAIKLNSSRQRSGAAGILLLALLAILVVVFRPWDAGSAQHVPIGAAAALQLVHEARVCGSPATDQYANVQESCLLASPVARWWREARAELGPAALTASMRVHIERRADYDGMAVRWGIGHTQPSVEACAHACLTHEPVPQSGHLDELPCNAFVWCAAEGGCWEPDIHKHSFGDCWLKFTEGPAAPEVNMRGELSQRQRSQHPDAPTEVQWHAGAVLPRGVELRNGSWSPRYEW